MTTPSAETTSEQERLDQLYSADRDLGFVLLGFPFATFSGALLIGFWGTLQRMPHRSDVPLWIALGFCVSFTAATLLSARSASRGLARAGLPSQEIRSRPHFEAAGLSRDEVREQMAATWRLGGGMILSIAACALLCLAFVGRELDRPQLLWILGSTSGCTAIGLLLLWRNQPKRRP
jgi:hypothetical protein